MAEDSDRGRRDEPGWLSELLAPVAGFGVTFSTMFKKVLSEEYPEGPGGKGPRPPKKQYHGRHQLNRWADGLEKCIGCELCAWACPADAIYVEGADNTDDARYSPGERYASIYQINYLRCIFCGLCIEACPTRALTMTNEYALADHSRESLIFTKTQLLAPLLPGMEQPPHPMRLGETDQDYYLGAGNRTPPVAGDPDTEGRLAAVGTKGASRGAGEAEAVAATATATSGDAAAGSGSRRLS